MTALERLRRLALELPGTVESVHSRKPGFRVGGQIFVVVWERTEQAGIRLLLIDAEALAQASPAAVARVYPAGRFGWIMVNLDSVSEPELRGLLRASWELAGLRGKGRGVSRPGGPAGGPRA